MFPLLFNTFETVEGDILSSSAIFFDFPVRGNTCAASALRWQGVSEWWRAAACTWRTAVWSQNPQNIFL